jgi:fido (protein-threonine AMPylation protein)
MPLAQTHPFVDGNSQVIRFVLNRAAIELLNRGIDDRLTQDRQLYLDAFCLPLPMGL